MNEEEAPAGWQARRLLRAARVGSLATSAGGQPFASLVTPACGPGGAVLLLLSELSEHTRHLRADPRCSLLVSGMATGANPQTAPRLTVTGVAELESDPAAKARWLAVHPYAARYAGFGDFALWRVVPAAGLLVGGFALATRLRGAELLPEVGAVAAVLQAEAGIISHCNVDHPAALSTIAGGGISAVAGDWRMVAADVDGCDLACGETVRRVAWPAPIADGEGARRALISLVRAARGQ